MTYADLRYHLNRLTPEQLAAKVRWVGEERGGKVHGLVILKEDQCNPSGDGWEPRSVVVKNEIEDGNTQEQADDFADSETVARAGEPFLWVDGGDPDMLTNPSEAICDHARENVFASCGTCFPVLR